MDPNKLVSDAAAEVHQAEAKGMSLAQQYWWAVGLVGFALGVIVKAVV
jgi:hypothetical protein